MSSSPPIPSSPIGGAAPSSPLFMHDSSSVAGDAPSIGEQRIPSSQRTPIHSSDLLRSDDLQRRRPVFRGDIHNSDGLSSPMNRRLFEEPRSNGSRNRIPRSSGNRLTSELSSEGDRIIPSFSSSTIGGGSSSAPGSDVNPHNDQNLSSNADEEQSETVRVIWGTNVSIQDCAERFRTFLMSFKMRMRKEYDGDDQNDLQDERLYYVDMLKMLKDTGATNINLDVKNLMSFPMTRSLCNYLITYPQEVIPIMDQTTKDCLISLILDDPDYRETPQTAKLVNDIESKIYKVRPYNIGNKKGMRELNPQDIDKLVSIKGLVIRSTAVIPDMKTAFFKCNVCDHTLVVENDRGLIHEPTMCPRQLCNARNSMQLIHNRSTYANKQVVKLQETPDIVPDGQTPHSVSLCLYDELVDSSRAGDRVEICGIFKSSPVKINPRQRTLKSLFKTYLDVVHIKKVDKHRLAVDASTIENEIRDQEEVDEVRKLSADEIERIKNVSKRGDVYELLARSLAPSIFEMDDVKKGILLQLFGGTNKDFKKGSRTRGDINILLCGDPSTSKSQMLQYVHKIAPRGIYTSGKGSSAVGLTAYVTRDIETRQLVLESGALVLSDGGVCCIDEFDKMSDQTRSVLHEVMEQQTISIAKAGIITTLNARTSILASANPIDSRYNPDLPVTKNIDLPPPLLSRFDLVYLILDRVDERLDAKLAEHIANMYLEDQVDSGATLEILPVEFLSAYVQYSKENIKPELTLEARDELVRAYVEMRKQGEDSRQGGSERRITATTRQLESMIRLSEAHAKLHLREHVLLEDVVEAVRLIKSAIKEYATDPLTGRIDMDLIQTGVGSEERKRQEDLGKVVLQILETGQMEYIKLSEEVQRQVGSVENTELGEALRRLETENRVVIFGQGHRRTIGLNNNGV
ncbi:MCM DNA helicase complex subunit [Martiniozyma asiatica (nom. inval.)]|nr:MCM DNA helicase complex subunit [Martiniozyma asiatica]